MPNTFGNYNYDLLCFLTDYPFTRQAKMRQADFVTGDGSFTAGGGIGAASQRLTGFIGGTLLGTNSIIDVWRTFVGFHNPGSPAALYLDYYEGTSFRYAEVDTITEIIPSPHLIGARQFEINFSYADVDGIAHQKISMTIEGHGCDLRKLGCISRAAVSAKSAHVFPCKSGNHAIAVDLVDLTVKIFPDVYPPFVVYSDRAGPSESCGGSWSTVTLKTSSDGGNF